MKSKPSDFTNQPIGSVLQKSEAETVAKNIMIILQRTGNTFRELPWLEYQQERIKDGNYMFIEQLYFDQVIGYCKSADTAILFSKAWQQN